MRQKVIEFCQSLSPLDIEDLADVLEFVIDRNIPIGRVKALFDEIWKSDLDYFHCWDFIKELRRYAKELGEKD